MSLKEQAMKAGADFSSAVEQLCLTYDVRAVIAMLLARSAQLSQTAIAAGCEKQFIAGLFEGSAEEAFKPCEHKPVVIYLNSETQQKLMRKQ